MFSFLWSGNVDKENFHLAKWEAIARPKLLEGWGVKNIFLFGKSFVAKSLWRGLFGIGLWSSILKEIYLKNILVTDWIRLHPKSLKGVSNIWHALVKSFFVIGDWCTWKVGNGEKIWIGANPWCGASNNWKLSKGLIHFLWSKGINPLSDDSSVLSTNGKKGWIQAQEISLLADLV